MFFLTKETVPAGVGFSTFGVKHLLWLFVIAVMCVVSVLVYRRLTPEKRNTMRLILGYTIVGYEILKDIVAAIIGDFGASHLPLHLCGINVLLVGFDLIKQTKTVRNFLYYFSIPGALLALFFPNWTVLPLWNFFNIHSFIIHGLLVLYPLILVAGGDLTPSVKMMPKCILLLVAMAIPIYFINLILDTNFMFLMEPETGNPLGLFEKYLGSHLWGFPILLPPVMFLMYIPIFLISKCKKRRSEIGAPLSNAETLEKVIK